MTRQCPDAVCQWAIVTVIVSLISVPVAAQTTPSAGRSSPATKWSPPRTADGQPDLQGVWDFGTLTPLERPAALGDKQVFSDEEAAAFEKEENRRQNRDLDRPGQRRRQLSARRRCSLQRVLVRARKHGDSVEAYVSHRRSA